MVPTRIPDEAAPGPTTDMREVLGTILRRWWLVIVVAVIVTLLAGAYSYSRTPVFTSQAEILVRPTLTNALEPDSSDQVNLQTELRIATSGAVAALARQRLGTAESPESILDHLSVTVPTDAQILEIAFSAFYPTEARLGAQAFADAYLAFKNDQALETIRTRTAELTNEIRDLDTQIDELAAQIAVEGKSSQGLLQKREELETTRLALRSQLAAVNILSTDPGQVIQPAQRPSSPSFPKHRLDLIVGAFIGLLAGAGIAFATERRRERAESSAWLEPIIEAPIVGMIPDLPWAHVASDGPVTTTHPRSAAAEAIRTLRTNLMVRDDPPIGSLLITSTWVGEGKTTIASNLAAAMAQLGRDVVLVSSDLRTPDRGSFFGVENSTGLMQVLAGDISLEDALQEPFDHVAVLPSGATAPVLEPVELLQSEGMSDVLERCAKLGFVIVDGAPILRVADSLVLSTMVDGVLFVANARHGRRDGIVQARYLLHRVEANLVGGVINRVRAVRSRP
jgi:capsular exopolysaccharide synthesis family protein